MPSTLTDVYLKLTTGSISNWKLYTPTVFNIAEGIDVGVNIHSVVDIRNDTLSGTVSDTATSFYYIQQTSPETYNLLDTFEVGSTSPTEADVETSWEVNGYLAASSLDVGMDSRLVDKRRLLTNDTESSFYTSNKSLNKSNDSKVDFSIYSGSSIVGRDVTVDITMSANRYYNYLTNVICGKLGALSSNYIRTDIDVDLGRTAAYKNDVFCSVSGVRALTCDAYSCVKDLKAFNYYFSTASGTIGLINNDVYSTEAYTELGVLCDVRLRSLFVENFSISVDTYSPTEQGLYVDVTDVLNDIDLDRTVFVVDDVEFQPIFEPMANGYRLRYLNLLDFWSNTSTTLTVRAVNVLNDVVEETFYLFFGYNTEFTDKIDYGFGRKIPVAFKATNFGKCPEDGFSSHYFVTKELLKVDLGANIRAVETVDLPATILPSSPSFFYGGSYTVTVSGIKDYSGNKLAPIVFSFTIENPTSN